MTDYRTRVYDNDTGNPFKWNGTAWVADPDATGSTTGAPVFVAASNATANEKTWAVATGGTVCDGTNDQTDITTACTAAAKGKVILSSGTFNIQAAMTLNTGCVIEGQGSGEETYSTRLLLGGNYTITLNPLSRLFTKLRGVLIETPTGFNTIALHVQATASVWNNHKILDDVVVKAYDSGAMEGGAGDLTAGSIGVQFSSSASACLAKCSIGHFTVCGYEKGVYFLLDGSGTQWKYINGNFFEYIGITYSKYPLTIANTSTSSALIEFTDNHFAHIDIQPCLAGTDTVDGLTISGTTATANGVIHGNVIEFIEFWDWDTGNGKRIVITGNTTNTTVYYNHIRGKYAIDQGAQGITDDFASTNGYIRYYKPETDAWVQTVYGHNFFEKITGSWSGGS